MRALGGFDVRSQPWCSALSRLLVLLVGLLAASADVAAAQAAGSWDPGIPADRFQDGTNPGNKNKPTHRLKPQPCDKCQDIVDKLQAALDSWNALALAGGEDDKKAGMADPSKAGTDKQTAAKAQIAAALAGLGAPADNGAKAKQDQQAQAKADPATFGKTAASAKDALAKQIKDLLQQLLDCLKKCPPPDEKPQTTGPKPTPPPGGGGGITPPPGGPGTRAQRHGGSGRHGKTVRGSVSDRPPRR